MPNTPASRMMNTLQNSALPVSQQWLPSDQPATQQDPVPALVQDVVPEQAPSILSNEQKLATFEAILSDLESQNVATATKEPLATPADPALAAPQYPRTGPNKEVAPGTLQVSAELPGGMQYIDSEPSPEISPELEIYLQKVEEAEAHISEEVITAAQPPIQQSPAPLPQNVKVLPITKEVEEAGMKKNTSNSIRWLVAFSRKLAEMFKGKAIYRVE